MSNHKQRTATTPPRILDLKPEEFMAKAQDQPRRNARELSLIEHAKAGIGLPGLVQRTGLHPTVVGAMVGFTNVQERPDYEQAIGLYHMLRTIGSEHHE